MNKRDIPIWLAVHKVYPEIESPRSDRWLRDVGARRELVGRVIAAMRIDESTEEAILRIFSNYDRAGTGSNKLQCERLLLDGAKCFWYLRGKGECSDEFDLGHVKAASIGGELTLANTMTECSHHNRSRGDMTIEEYLAKPHV